MVSTDEPFPCFNDILQLCRKQQERIDTLEAACQQAVKEIDTLPRSEWALNVVRTLLSHAMEPIE